MRFIGDKDGPLGDNGDATMLAVTKRLFFYQLTVPTVIQGRAHQPPQRSPMDLTCHHLETII